ncbi:MAG: hypothetical protein L0229_10720 [Blastocatellia bacterium]|nr:hypothetical protein [Blastocatellia bacterium]
MDANQIDVVLKVVALLEKLNIPYVIGGSFASSIHGLPRATHDADLIALIKPEQAVAFAAELQEEFYADEQTIKHAVRTKRHFNVIHLDSIFKVDIFVAKPSRFETTQIERRQLKILSKDLQQKAYIASAEDTILAKLDWYRRGNQVSDQQWEDIKGVIKVQIKHLDMQYLKHWAQELNVSDLLERALAECG